jgi:hypothetical protein
MTGHASQYALDRAALGAPADPALAAHLRGCERCARIVAERRAAGEVPAWVAQLKVRPTPVPRARWWRRLRWLLPIPAVAALAAALLLAYLPREDGAGLRAKGGPAVALWVKRGEAVSPWDGKSALRPGDRVRLAVRGAGFTHVSIASLAPSGDPTPLYRGTVEREGETVLPLSFRVEPGGPAEVLSVILASRPIDDGEHATAAGAAARRGLWTTRIEIRKEEVR